MGKKLSKQKRNTKKSQKIKTNFLEQIQTIISFKTQIIHTRVINAKKNKYRMKNHIISNINYVSITFTLQNYWIKQTLNGSIITTVPVPFTFTIMIVFPHTTLTHNEKLKNFKNEFKAVHSKFKDKKILTGLTLQQYNTWLRIQFVKNIEDKLNTVKSNGYIW